MSSSVRAVACWAVSTSPDTETSRAAIEKLLPTDTISPGDDPFDPFPLSGDHCDGVADPVCRRFFPWERPTALREESLDRLSDAMLRQLLQSAEPTTRP